MKDSEKRSLLHGENEHSDVSHELTNFEPDIGHKYMAIGEENGCVNGYDGEYRTLTDISDDVDAIKHKGITLSWQNIEVTSPEKTAGIIKRKVIPPVQILKSVSGVAEPGNMVAIMGASGSGKTTLLNVLTGRNSGELNVQGQVLINGKPAYDRIAYVSGYIQQEDLFIGTLTVREHLWFNAKLRMPREISDEERERKINESIQELGLMRSQNTLIGIPGLLKGLSGGEKKRLALASELLNNPKLMFADEPTSGLDSFMAASVVECLINLAKKGRTVLCTIHQPASDVYAMFPQVMLLAEGQTVYLGPTPDLPTVFAQAGYNIPSGFNPADFFIKNLAIIPGREQECRERVKALVSTYEESPQYQKVRWFLEHTNRKDDFIMEMERVGEESYYDQAMKKYEVQKSLEEKGGLSRYEAGFGTQFNMLFWRCWLGFARNKKILPARIAQIIATGFILGLVYYQQDYNQTGISNFNGAIFMLMIQVSFNTSFTIAVAFISEYAIFLKEHRDRSYCVLAYYLAKTLCDMPALVVATFIYSTTTYWMIGFYDNGRDYIFFALGLMLIAMTAVAMGHMAGAICPNPQLCLTLLPLVLGICLTFAGFLVREDSILPIFLPILYISPYRYTYTGLMILQWRDVNYISCSYSSDYDDWYDSGNATTSDSCLSNGYMVLRDYGYNPADVHYVFGIVLAIYAFIEILGFLVLWRRGSKA